MSFINNFNYAFSWMLIHSIWQTAIIYLIVQFILTSNNHFKSSTRYILWISGYFIQPFVSLITFLKIYNKTAIIILKDNIGSYSYLMEIKTIYFISIADSFLKEYLNYIIYTWLICTILQLFKLLGNYNSIKCLSKKSVNTLPDQWSTYFNSIASKLAIRKNILFFESSKITVPMVIGCLKPILLLPVGLINNLPKDQVEAIILHELAHIMRNDFIINIFQTILEVIFFFNPFIKLISNKIRLERENCCDDLVISNIEHSITLAKALLNFKAIELKLPTAPLLFAKKANLKNRVYRIIEGNTIKTPVGKIWLYLFTCVLSLLMVYVFANNFFLKPIYAKQNVQSPLKKTKHENINNKISPIEINIVYNIPGKRKHSKVLFVSENIDTLSSNLNLITLSSNEQQTLLNAAQKTTNDQQTVLNKIQTSKNLEQFKINEVQRLKNEQMSALNNLL